MFGNHPGTRYICRHCRKPAGYDPELCFYCGPICGDCQESGPCPVEDREKKEKEKEKKANVKKSK